MKISCSWATVPPLELVAPPNSARRERRAEELQQQLAAAQECARQLREQLGAEAAGRRAAEGAARKLQGELDVARDAHARDARRWDEREQRWAAAEDAARREHDAAVRAVKAQHAAELDQVSGEAASAAAACFRVRKQLLWHKRAELQL